MLLYGPNVEMDQTKETFGEEYCLLKPLTNSLLGPAIIYAAESVVLHPIQIAHLDGYVYLQVPPQISFFSFFFDRQPANEVFPDELYSVLG